MVVVLNCIEWVGGGVLYWMAVCCCCLQFLVFYGQSGARWGREGGWT